MSAGPGQKQGGSKRDNMEVASRLHGRPLQRLNNLARWYIKTSLIGFIALGLIGSALVFFELFFGLPRVDKAVISLFALLGSLSNTSVLLFLVGLGGKFLPSSFGGKTHLHSLKALLWSYWFFVAGIGLSLVCLVWLLFSASISLTLFPKLFGSVLLLGWFLPTIATGITTWNFWKTVEPRAGGR